MIKKIFRAMVVSTSLALLALPAAAASVTIEKAEPGSIYGSSGYNKLVRVNFDGVYNNRAVRAGMYELQESSGGDSFTAWCIDLLENLLLPADYEKSTGLSTSALQKLDKLFGGFLDEVVDGTTAAAFQLAIWELLYDPDTDISSGDFSATAPSGGVIGKAQYFLDNLDAQKEFEGIFSIYLTPGSQDLISVDAPISFVAALPVPASSISLLGALGAVVFIRRRKRAIH